MHFGLFRTLRSALTNCALAVAALVLGACSDSTTGTGPPPPLGDDRLVAFVSDSRNFSGTSIFIMRGDGSHTTRVTSGEFHDDLPAWSPNGTTIAFTSDRAPAGIWVVNADGSELRSLVTATQPAWSPNGHSIAFSAALNDSVADFPGVLVNADADGSHARRLTTS